jgi:spermidine synthase/tetratricopeptide (TPR) repeat protein
LPVAVIGALAVTCLFSKFFMPTLAVVLRADVRQTMPTAIGHMRGTLSGNALVCVMASMLLELIPSIAMGILFPLFVDLTRASASRVGRTVGDVYAWNTFGSIVGASLTSLLLFPSIGTYGSIALATGLYVIALVLVLPFGQFNQRLVSAGCVAVGAAIVFGILTPQDPVYTNVGKYLYGDTLRANEFTTLYFAEGASSNVLVAKSNIGGNVNLRVNGKVDASDHTDMITQAGLAYIPRLFKPDATDVMVIGFGSGTTSGASLLFPGTRVTCCEIEPAVYRAAEHFGHVNHKPYEHTREWLLKRNAELPEDQRLSESQIEEQATFQVIFGDGRTTLQGSDQKYDLIISEPSNPWLAGVSNLFTREFFHAARTHLKQGGILAQWVQTYNLKKDEYYLILRTLRSEFPHCVICTGGPADTLLLASEQPIVADPAAIDRLQKLVDQTPEIHKDLAAMFHITDLRSLLLRSFTANEQSLDKKAEVGSDKPLNTDLNLLLEFLAPLHLYSVINPKESATGVVEFADTDAQTSLAKSLKVSLDSVAFKRALALRALSALQPNEALRYFREALGIDPKDKETQMLLELALHDFRSPALTVETFQKLAAANPKDESYLIRLADAYGQNKQNAEQLKTLEDYIARTPKTKAVRQALARYYLLLNDHEAALAVYKQLEALYPDSNITLAQIAQELLALKRPAESAEYYRKALSVIPKPDEDDQKDTNNSAWLWANNLAWIYATNTDQALRNGVEAVRLAKQACDAVDLSQPQKIFLIDTLACAYAENGQFSEAVEREKEFVDKLKRDGGNPQTIQAAEERVKLFETNVPYRER